MRLWHKYLMPYLPRQQLLGQWRECCAIAKSIAETGTPNHVLVNKIMEYPIDHFVTYTAYIAHEMDIRGYKVDQIRFTKWQVQTPLVDLVEVFKDWHNDRYLKQCLHNLQEKADCGAIPEEEWKKITDRWPEMK